MVQFFDTTVVGGLWTDFWKLNHFFPVDMEINGEVVIVPQLEQGHVQTDVRGIQTAVFRELQEHGIQVLDVIYLLQRNIRICYGFCSFPSRS